MRADAAELHGGVGELGGDQGRERDDWRRDVRHFRVSDAAMSHYANSDIYRGVSRGEML